MYKKIVGHSIFLLALILGATPLYAQGFRGAPDKQEITSPFSPEISADKLEALKRQSGQGVPNKAAQVETSRQEKTTTDQGEKPKDLTPPKKSRAEEFFSRPETSIGQVINSSSRSREFSLQTSVSEDPEPFAKKMEITEQNTKGLNPLEQKTTGLNTPEQNALIAYLLSEQKTLSGPEKVTIFLKLEQSQRQKYLKFLSLPERESFLKSFGEKGRFYLEDLQVAAVDKDLQQFGYSFFEPREGGFVPETMALVGPDYVVGPGDTLIVSLWGNIDATFETTIDRNGEIILPKVGAIHLWGQTFSEAKETIRLQIAKYFTNFQMNVTMGALRSIQVYVVGEANGPGTYTLSSLSTVLSAMVAAGGPAKTGSLRQVQLLRGGAVVAEVDFYSFFLNGDRSGDARLQSGDTIHIPMVGPLVGVAGDVRHPAIFELKERESLQDVLRMAGGVRSTAYLNRVQVERIVAHQRKISLDLDLSPQGEAPLLFPLQDRDLVKVSPISTMSRAYVVVDGYAARPGQYQFVEGMRLTDLITPYDNLLPETFRGMADVLRMRPPLYQPEKITIELEKALAGDLEQNILLQEFDEVRLFSREEMEELAEVDIAGDVLNPGTFRLYREMKVRDLVMSAGNVKRSAYLGDAELTRYTPVGKETRTERLTINLERALSGDPQENILLHPYDHLVVRPIPDLKDRPTVTILGKVLFPGTYTVVRGEKLSSLLSRAGGFAEGAYLRGALFARESVKIIQKERLDKLIFEQEQAVSRVAADIAAGALSPEEATSAQTLMLSQKAMIEKIKQAPVTGRMVIHLAPLDTYTDSVDDIELLAGDLLTIPENPQSVAVLGQVYNPISLSYQPGMSVAHYLDKVGGATKNAETSEMSIVRADGTVFSKQQAGMGVQWSSDSHHWIFGGFNITEIYAGDTILVPEKIKRSDVMREAKDLSQILFQMAIAVAAVASF